MDSLERALAEAMKREPAPDWLESAILERIRRERREPLRASWFRAPWMRWAGAMAMLAVVLAGLHYERVRRERLAGERAGRQVLLALEITGSKLLEVEKRVQAIGHFKESR
jgi:hypothetical protein